MGNRVGNSSAHDRTRGERKAKEKLFRAQDSFWKKNINASRDMSIEKVAEKDTGKPNKISEDGECILEELDADDADESRDNRVRSAQSYAKTYSEMDIDLTLYDFPFENLVFKGGGSKGLSYIGGIQVMEELGILPKIRRFAGASAGAFTALLLAIGCDSELLRRVLGKDFDKVAEDHSCGYLSLFPNVIRRFGWNSGNKLLKWFGDIIKAKNLHPDITFAQLYKARNVELSVVVTNLSLMSVEFFHPKTTPNVPVRKATRMSISIPGLFQACHEETYGLKNVYVDGGILCNYPISCFDGWWLSMKKEDRFMTRIHPDDDVQNMFDRQKMFTSTDPSQFEKTLGYMVFSDNERDVLREAIEQRDQLEKSFAPSTTLKKKSVKKDRKKQKAWSEHMKTRRAINAFFKEENFPQRYRERIFGENVSVEEAFEALDIDGSGEIEFNELRHFAERSGVSIQTQILGDRRQEINGFVSYFSILQSTILNNASGSFVKDSDVERTIGINTGHVTTTDFKLEDGDLDFLVEQGRRSTEAFLKWFVVEKHPRRKKDINGDDAMVNGTGTVRMM